MFFLDRYVHFSVFSHSITFSPIFNAVATYDTLVIKVVLPSHIKSFFYYLVKTLPHNRSYPSTTTTIPHRTTDTYKAHRSTPISSILPSWYNTYLLKSTKSAVQYNLQLLATYYNSTYTLTSSLPSTFRSAILTLFLKYVRSMKQSSSLPVFSPVL